MAFEIASIILIVYMLGALCGAVLLNEYRARAARKRLAQKRRDYLYSPCWGDRR
ncbi:MAG: hypothetical protein IJS44_04130 [Clostridia bacterium]|nr:hypothetical protein [Clostridia bacterium]